MPEKNYPPRFDFKKLEPDVPVEFTLLKESRSGKATNEKGEDYEWHLWSVKHTGIEMSLFTPNERVHAGLQSLKVQPQGKFTLTKKASVNTETGKPFIYYHIQYGEESIDTKDSLPMAPKTEEAEDSLADTPYIKEPEDVERDPVKLFMRDYNRLMDIKISYLEKRISMQKLTDGQFAEILIALDKSTSANVSTILIQNGK